MFYLDVLIGFSLVMLVFSSVVSVAVSGFKRLLTVKGRAVAGPLLAELGRVWHRQGLDPAAWMRLHQGMTASLSDLRGPAGQALRWVPIADGETILRLLQGEGRRLLGEAQGGVWDQVVAEVRSGWRGVSGRLAASYERHTRHWVFAVAVLSAVVFNVDAVRILRVLSVSAAARERLAPLADQLTATAGDGAKELGARDRQSLQLLSSWQRENLAELAGQGLPLGWESAPIAICRGGVGRLPGRVCTDGVDPGATFWLWLVRLLGLLIGAGLIAQGAPTWYSVFDSAINFKKILERGREGQGPALAGVLGGLAGGDPVEKR